MTESTHTGQVERIPFEKLGAPLQDQLRARVERLGYLGEFFQVFANEPESLFTFNAFTEALKKALPDKLTEVVALTVATRAENQYELNQHVRLSLKLGFGDEWVKAVCDLDPSHASQLSSSEVAVQKLVLSCLDAFGQGADPHFEEVVRQCGEREAVAILLLVGRYATHAIAVNCLALEPPVPNPLKGGAS